MPEAQVQRLRSDYATIRKGNRKAASSFWAQGNRLFLAVSVAVVLAAFAMAFVWTSYQAVQTGYTISSLHQQRSQLTETNRQLKVELANLTALDRLEKLASGELGLSHPKPRQLVVIE